MLLLFETAAGFALFKVLQEGKVTAAEPEVGRRMPSFSRASSQGYAAISIQYDERGRRTATKTSNRWSQLRR